jgi:transcriptional regulator GlxA family with amidase domain
VGAVLFPGFELLDVFGPLEMFGLLGGRAQILTLAEQAGAVRSSQGPVSLADAPLSGARDLDVLFVPSGWGTRREVSNEGLLGELRRLSQGARLVAGVCTGAALLARAGILDGRRATSNKKAFKWVASQGPKVDWIAQARWVEDGKFFTSAGVSAGMDMALALIARLFGRETGVAIARDAEYEWHEDAGWDPFAKLNGLT